MARQLDQLPPDATSLARRVQALERQVTELRGARRMGSATVGSLRVYSDDGETLLAELGQDTSADGGGGLWTRGLQSPNNMSAFLGSGELAFRPVENGLVAVPASIYYNSDAWQYSDLILTSGAVNATDHRAMLILESLWDGLAHASFQGESSSPCGLDVLGVLTSSNLAMGSTSITPFAANTPTSQAVTGLNVSGASFVAFVSAGTSVPGTQVTVVGFSGLSSTGLTLWVTRTNTTATTVHWMVVGL